MTWRVVSRNAELAAAPLAVSPAIAYGLFQQALLRQAAQPGPDAAAALQANAARVLASLITTR